ncbi:MAG: hypothetical protein KME27_05780 [Lyngbya sp. HA4199-MV5]|nr:hypothetical protein [Lyngbya sp. HA4199-MV5]
MLFTISVETLHVTSLSIADHTFETLPPERSPSAKRFSSAIAQRLTVEWVSEDSSTLAICSCRGE